MSRYLKLDPPTKIWNRTELIFVLDFLGMGVVIMIGKILLPCQVLNIKRESAIAAVAQVFTPVHAEIDSEVVGVLPEIPKLFVYNGRIVQPRSVPTNFCLPYSSSPAHTGI